ncbi:MAG TPA: Hsp70 family protein [Verrucomicrobiota bacterium]|nr:Hsp70 family protein [Verrucomicrobiota bacterium]
MRSTIDFGIDLGTTNSAIALLKDVATEIIKNNADADITPSAVSIDKKGAIHVGQRAKNKIIDAPEDAYVEFKRRMGSDHVYQFKSSGQARKPEDLSAEVLKSLRADVQQRTGEVIEAAVVTVPAAFELHQCDATRKAAQLAGFKECPLLQEPVAAALAYGFQVDGEKAYWLVYDFGGGTFDAAIIKAEEGTINVVNHGGDNFLGGSDIDWAIVEQVLVPKLLEEHDLDDFTRGNKKWRQALAKLKRAAEVAKIDLSRSERATLESCKFNNGAGDEIEFECDLTRAEVIRVAEPVILRSVEICRRVLKEKNLGKDAIHKVILVGGPTLAPYFREMLRTNLGIPLDHSVDPLTVVARGAAVFAGTQKVTAGPKVPAAQGEFTVDLKHKPVGLDSAPMVGGRVSAAGAQDFSGFTIELVNAKTQWRSGKIPLRPDGVFMANLHAERGERNTFLVELFDATGRKQKVTPDSLTYTIGAVVEEQPLINSMGIALANNEYDKFFEKGRGLPLKATRDFKTIHPLRQGQSGEFLRIPVIEGEQELADRNRKVGELSIPADNIRRDLPGGSQIEVTLSITTDRIIKILAYVPLLDEEFPGKIEMGKRNLTHTFLKQDFEAEIHRFQEAKAKAASANAGTAQELVEQVENSPLLREVEETLAASKDDADAAAKCEKRLLELKLKLDEAANSLEWPALVAEAQDWLGYLNRVADKTGTPQQKEKAGDLTEQTDEIIRERKADRLRKKIDNIARLYYEIVMAQPGWWVYQFQRMEEQQDKMMDPPRAARLLDQGRDCISKNNNTGLQNVVRQLWDLLPDELVQAAKRGYQSGIVR